MLKLKTYRRGATLIFTKSLQPNHPDCLPHWAKPVQQTTSRRMLSSPCAVFPVFHSPWSAARTSRCRDRLTSRMHTSNDEIFVLSDLCCRESALKYMRGVLGAYVTTKGIYWMLYREDCASFPGIALKRSTSVLGRDRGRLLIGGSGSVLGCRFRSGRKLHSSEVLLSKDGQVSGQDNIHDSAPRSSCMCAAPIPLGVLDYSRLTKYYLAK